MHSIQAYRLSDWTDACVLMNSKYFEEFDFLALRYRPQMFSAREKRVITFLVERKIICQIARLLNIG